MCTPRGSLTSSPLQDNLLLDLYLAPHVRTLYTQIRNRALIQYFSPYVSAEMHKKAAAFNTTVAALEDELTQLILEGLINARIDSHSKVGPRGWDCRVCGVEAPWAVLSLLILSRYCMLEMWISVAPPLRSPC